MHYMSKYIVIVEYLGTLNNEEKIYDLICSLGNTEQISEHAFLLSSDKQATFIRDIIKNSPYEVNRIFVSKVSIPAAWRNTMADNIDIKELFHE